MSKPIVCKDCPKEANNKTETSRKAFICPHYQGVCGLDEDIVCYCPNYYEMCDKYKEACQDVGNKDIHRVVLDCPDHT